jgi:hypothetical protein
MGGVITEEKAISRDQCLDLVYSQTSTLYYLIHDAPHPSTTPTSTNPKDSHAANGVIGTFHVDAKSMHVSHTNPKYNAFNVQHALTPTNSIEKTLEVNSV